MSVSAGLEGVEEEGLGLLEKAVDSAAREESAIGPVGSGLGAREAGSVVTCFGGGGEIGGEIGKGGDGVVGCEGGLAEMGEGGEGGL